VLSFRKGKKKGRKCINNRVLNNQLLDCAVKLAIWECYLSETDTAQGGIIAATVHDECVKLNDIDTNFNEAVLLQGKVTSGEATEEEKTSVADLCRRMDEAWDRVVAYDILQQYPRKCDDDFFFELLITFTSRAAFKLQDLSNKSENLDRNRLLERLVKLKKKKGIGTRLK
jgi:hypothetical protein